MSTKTTKQVFGLEQTDPETLAAVARASGVVTVENTSGIIPIEYKVLVRLDKAKEKTQGGIIIPEDTRDRKAMAEVKGTLIAKGGKAFEDFGDPSPKSGDRVMIAKYAGKMVAGADGEEYRLVSDKDVSSILTDESVRVTDA